MTQHAKNCIEISVQRTVTVKTIRSIVKWQYLITNTCLFAWSMHKQHVGIRQAALQTYPRHLKQVRAGRSAVVAEHSVELLGDPDESGPAAQLLQFARADVGAGGADPTQDVPYCHINRTFVKNFDRLPLRRSGGKRTESTMCTPITAL